MRLIHPKILCWKNASFPQNSWQVSVFKHSLLLNKMQSGFPFGHFCADNNRLTMENAQAYCFFTRGRGELCASTKLAWGFEWNRSNVQDCAVHQLEKVSLFGEFRDRNHIFCKRTATLCMQISLCDVSRKEFASWPITLKPIVLVLHDLYLSCSCFDDRWKYGGHFQT